MLGGEDWEPLLQPVHDAIKQPRATLRLAIGSSRRLDAI